MANMSSFPAMYMAVVTMQQYETTQLARLPLLLLDYAERQDLDRDELMRKAGLSGWQLESPDARISTRSMRNLWRAVIERLNRHIFLANHTPRQGEGELDIVFNLSLPPRNLTQRGLKITNAAFALALPILDVAPVIV